MGKVDINIILVNLNPNILAITLDNRETNLIEEQGPLGRIKKMTLTRETS